MPPGKRNRPRGDAGLPHVDLVAGDESPCQIAGANASADLPLYLFRAECRGSRQESYAAHAAARSAAVAPLRIRQELAKHLIASADTEDRSPGLSILQDSCFQTDLTEPDEIIHRIFCPRKNDKIRLPKVRRSAHIAHAEIWVGSERRNICEIRDTRQTYDRNVDRAVMTSSRKPRGQAVLVIYINIRVGDYTEHRHLCQILKHAKPRPQDLCVAPEFIDYCTYNSRPLIFIEKHDCSVELCKYPAGIYISHKNDGGIDHAGKPHVDYIIRFQINFRRASSALDHDDIIFSFKTPESFHDIRNQCLFHTKILSRAVCSPDTTVHDQLASDIAGRLQQDRIHADIRKHPACLRLRCLSSSHFETVRCYVTVQGHVLALKRCDFKAVLMKNAAQGGDKKALSCTGHSPLYHNFPAMSHIISSAAADTFSLFTCPGFSAPIRQGSSAISRA